MINKPKNLGQHDLLAILNVGEIPVKPQGLTERSYEKSELAINEFDRKVQIYVNSDTKKGLQDFQKDYPNAEITDLDTVLDPERWKRLAFTEGSYELETPIERYFRAKHTEIHDTEKKEKIKEERKRR